MIPYLVGIDLGTTNCAVAYVDTRAVRDPAAVRARRFQVPQLVAMREVAPGPVLPSFLYFGTPHEHESGALSLPWAPDAADAVGVLARDHGALLPSRQVASAKSWLAHAAVDRTAPILPVGREPGEPGISPVDASARYLRHIRSAWDHAMAAGQPDLRLEHQQVVLTVPASFDDEARELTAEAAARAGLAHVTLIEEPIAALYAWLSGAGSGRQRARPRPGSLVLVCDVGGGTTDFSLIRARDADGDAGFERVAIGEHLLLGGDNLDLALAALVEMRLGDARLSFARREAVRRQCTGAKERLLSNPELPAVPLTVLGGGRAVVGGAAVVELTQDDVLGRLLEGFLPRVEGGERPAQDRRLGLRELGLPYESDPAITRHLAAFLGRSGEAARPDFVLFNGGFFAPAVARERVTDVLAAWFGAAPTALFPEQPDAAVAMGAAFYAALRHLPGAQRDLFIRAGSPRTYYIALGQDDVQAGHVRAVTVLGRGAEEGTRSTLDRRFRVPTNLPVAFTLYSSTARTDSPGSVNVEPAETLHRHAPLAAVLRYGKRSSRAEVDVSLSVQFTEVGTLELWLEAQTGHRWRLRFELRGESSRSEEDEERREDAVVIGDEPLEGGIALVREVFQGPPGAASVGPELLVASLEERLGYGRQAWPIEALRRVADALLAAAAGRTRSPAHESRWLNLTGFCVRPGFGASADPWRIGELRKVYTAGLAFPKDVQCQVEWLVLWQRAAGGFSAGQQQELARRLTGSLALGSKKAPRLNQQIERESWRLLASLERLDTPTRVRVGDAILERLRREPRNTSLSWSLGRVGARVPFYGPLDRVVSPDVARRWVEGLVALKQLTPESLAAVGQIAARTGDPARDVADETRDAAIARLRELAAPREIIVQLTDPVQGDRALQGVRYFGEALPSGLRLADED